MDAAALGAEVVEEVEEESESERPRRRAKAWCVQTEDGAHTWKESDESEFLPLSNASAQAMCTY